MMNINRILDKQSVLCVVINVEIGKLTKVIVSCIIENVQNLHHAYKLYKTSKRQGMPLQTEMKVFIINKEFET